MKIKAESVGPVYSTVYLSMLARSLVVRLPLLQLN